MHSLSFFVQCTKNVIQNKIISSEKDLLGVVFFGTVRILEILFLKIYIVLLKWRDMNKKY